MTEPQTTTASPTEPSGDISAAPGALGAASLLTAVRRVGWRTFGARAGVAAGYSMLVAVLEIWILVDVTDRETTTLDRLFVLAGSAALFALVGCLAALRGVERR